MWSVTVCRVLTRVECDHEAEVCCRHARLRVGGTKRLLSMGHASVFALLLVALAGGCGSGPAAVWGRPRPRPRIPAAHGRLRWTATFLLSRWSRRLGHRRDRARRAYGLAWTIAAAKPNGSQDTWNGTLLGLDPTTGTVNAQLASGGIPHFGLPRRRGGEPLCVGAGHCVCGEHGLTTRRGKASGRRHRRPGTQMRSPVC